MYNFCEMWESYFKNVLIRDKCSVDPLVQLLSQYVSHKNVGIR